MPKYQHYAVSSANKRPVLIDGVRTAFVKSFGAFQNADALELFSRVIDGLIRKTEIDPVELDEVACGVVIPQTKNANVGRDAILNLGYPSHIHGYTINRACTSSMHTIADAAKSIAFGNPHMVLAGGVECLSDVPITYSDSARKFLLTVSKAKTTAARLKALASFHAKDWIPKPPGLSEPLTGYTMGEHAEMMAKINEISRTEQDEFALMSHQRTFAAMEAGKFDEEVVPVWSPPKYDQCVEKDNIVRGDSNMDQMAKLKPAFDKRFGTITAANASPLTDGAAVSLIADEGRAKALGLVPKSLIRDMMFVGVQPHPQLLLGPAIAIPLLLKKNGLSLEEIDLFEIHEAFAAQVLSCLKVMKSADFMKQHFGDSKPFGEIPMEKLNVNGGAIAIGHPFGATGSRLVTTLTNELIRSNKRLGVIAICAAGGMSGAMLIERL